MGGNTPWFPYFDAYFMQFMVLEQNRCRFRDSKVVPATLIIPHEVAPGRFQEANLTPLIAFLKQEEARGVFTPIEGLEY